MCIDNVPISGYLVCITEKKSVDLFEIFSLIKPVIKIQNIKENSQNIISDINLFFPFIFSIHFIEDVTRFYKPYRLPAHAQKLHIFC